MKFASSLLLIWILADVAPAQPQSIFAGCQVFPPNNIWNVRADTMPLHPNSTNIVNSIGAAAHLRLDDIMPINVASNATPKLLVTPDADNDDPGLYAFPSNAVLESGSDAHLIAVDQDTCILYEAYFAVRAGTPPAYTWNVLGSK